MRKIYIYLAELTEPEKHQLAELELGLMDLAHKATEEVKTILKEEADDRTREN